MQRPRRLLATLSLAIGLFVVACASTNSPPAGQGASLSASTAVATTAPTSATAATPTAPVATSAPTQAASSATPAAAASASAATPSTSSSSTTSGSIVYNVASGTTANYRVREQLARLNAPSDAVGKTSSITGSIVLTSDGKIASDQSKITVDLTSLQSDSSMRDGFIDRSTLQTSQYPTAVFVPTSIKGLDTPLPTSGQQTWQLLGNLTVHGVTKPVTWDVSSQVQGNDVTGKATVTNLKFGDFGMTPPQAGAVLSVNDSITLELSFHLSKAA